MTRRRTRSPVEPRYMQLLDANMELRRVNRIARSLAEERLQPGDRVSRELCGGGRGTFTFSHWEGNWACGKSVDDCPTSSIFKINGEPVDFIAEAFAKIDGEGSR